MPRQLSLEWFRQRIEAKEPVTFSRWGDGEWNALLARKRGQNCDGHPYYPKMGHELKQVLLSKPAYTLGLQSLAVRIMPELTTWIEQNYLKDLDWVDADVFHHASGNGEMVPLVYALRKVPVVVIGPPHLHQPLKEVLNYAEHVIVPPKNCYLGLGQLIVDSLGVLDKMPKGTVVAVSASMPAKLLIDALHKRVGDKHHLIDFGSVWDFYAGIESRKYMKAMSQAGRAGDKELRES